MPAASGPSWLQEFCLKSQGCLRVSQRDEEFQGLLEDLYAGLLSSYQVAYRPANTQPPGASLELKVQVCSTQGYGEALSAIAIPAEPPSPEGGPA